MHFKRILSKSPTDISTTRLAFSSKWLGRVVHIDLYYPKQRKQSITANGIPIGFKKHAILLFNDGQFLLNMGIISILRKHLRRQGQSFILVAIHSNEHRKNELGTTHLEANDLGQQSAAYQNFLIHELLPKFSDKTAKVFIAGFSLGGLSALDTAINHPELFTGVGVFSGALWWRSQPFQPKNPDANLIIPKKIELLTTTPNLRFWLQAGTLDETNDRNNNGVIDSIDDTLLSIRSLLKKGVKPSRITYLEKKGGKHNTSTWATMLPHFLSWSSRIK